MATAFQILAYVATLVLLELGWLLALRIQSVYADRQADAIREEQRSSGSDELSYPIPRYSQNARSSKPGG